MKYPKQGCIFEMPLLFLLCLCCPFRIDRIMFKLRPFVSLLLGSLLLLVACQDDSLTALRKNGPLILPPAIEDPSYGAESNPTDDVIGGGYCYSQMVETWDYYVADAASFLEALELAQPGQIIRVADDAVIDLSGMINLVIPSGVTLAGNRGQCLTRGPIIKNSGMAPGTIWFWVKDNVRITGLRFQGPDDLFVNINYDLRPSKSAICFAVGEANVEIDNCEIFQFSRGAIEIYPDGTNVYVHHNFLHDIHAYPVITLNRSILPVLIEANLIYWVWHATAGSGYPGTGYEARYNIMVRQPVPQSWLPYGGDHAVDMHPYLPVLVDRGQRIAGDELHIHHNTFLNAAGADPSVANSPDAFVRGTPRTLAQFYNNRFLNTAPERAIVHYDGNVWVHNNKYGPEEVLIPIAQETTPQILFNSPPPPDVLPASLTINQIPIDIEVNALGGLSITQVTIELNGESIYSGESPPEPGTLQINACGLSQLVPYHELTVTATDNRGVVGKHTTSFRGNCSTD